MKFTPDSIAVYSFPSQLDGFDSRSPLHAFLAQNPQIQPAPRPQSMRRARVKSGPEWPHDDQPNRERLAPQVGPGIHRPDSRFVLVSPPDSPSVRILPAAPCCSMRTILTALVFSVLSSQLQAQTSVPLSATPASFMHCASLPAMNVHPLGYLTAGWTVEVTLTGESEALAAFVLTTDYKPSAASGARTAGQVSPRRTTTGFSYTSVEGTQILVVGGKGCYGIEVGLTAPAGR